MKLPEWQAKGVYFSYQNRKICYTYEGNGPVLVLLHGFPTSSYDWHKIHENLSKQFKVLTFDMIGYGFSDKPLKNHYSIFQQADIAEALLKYLEINSCHLLAHDKGDTLANELIARQNEGKLAFKIMDCCFLNGGLFPSIHKPRPVQWALMTPLGKYIARLYNFKMFQNTFNRIFGPETKANRQELEDLWYLMNYKDGMKIFHLLIRYLQDRIDHEERWLKALQETKIPLRLIDGAFDPISGKHMAAHYLKVIPNPDVVLLENIGHYPQIEAPEAVLKYFFEFQAKPK
jgi:pimeloyl-ACP methyl ester carboxylesterase